MGSIIKQYATIIPINEGEQANQFVKENTSVTHDLFYVKISADKKTITHYISHHPFTDNEAKVMADYFEHFYDMTLVTIKELFMAYGLSYLSTEEE